MTNPAPPRNPIRATLVCTGGSAPVHAATIAKLLHINRVVFPFAAGVASAFGLFSSSEGVVLQRSRRMLLDRLPEGAIVQRAAEMVQSDAYAASLVARGAQITVKLGMRYEGQSSEVTVTLGDGGTVLTVAMVRDRFLAVYEDIFGLSFPGFAVEVSTWFVEVSLPSRLAPARGYGYEALRPGAKAAKGHRPCHIGAPHSGSTDLPVFDRYALSPGWTVEGPALIEEHDTTIFIPLGMVARVATSFDLVAERAP